MFQATTDRRPTDADIAAHHVSERHASGETVKAAYLVEGGVDFRVIEHQLDGAGHIGGGAKKIRVRAEGL